MACADPSQMPIFKGKPVPTRVAISAGTVSISVLLTLILGEVFVRLAVHPSLAGAVPRYLHVFHEEAGYVLAPGFRSPPLFDEAAGRWWPGTRTNRLGARSAEVPRDKPSGAFRVLSYGDSFTYGYAVEDEETFTWILHRLLSDVRPGSDALNFGVSYNSTYNQFGWLRGEGMELDPDLVLLNLYLGNDLIQNVYDRGRANLVAAYGQTVERKDRQRFRAFLGDRTVYFRAPQGIAARTDRWLHYRSRLYRELSDALFSGAALPWLQAAGLVEIVPLRVEPVPRRLTGEDEVMVTVDLLEEIEHFLKTRGVALLVNLIPTSWAVPGGAGKQVFESDSRIEATYQDYMELTVSVARALRESGLQVVDLYQHYLRDVHLYQPTYGAFDSHFSPEDHEYVAAILFDRIRRQYLGNHGGLAEEAEATLKRHISVLTRESRPGLRLYQADQVVSPEILDGRYHRLDQEAVMQIQVDPPPDGSADFRPADLLRGDRSFVWCRGDGLRQAIRVSLSLARPTDLAAVSVTTRGDDPDFRVDHLRFDRLAPRDGKDDVFFALNDGRSGDQSLQIFDLGVTSSFQITLQRFAGSRCSMLQGIDLYERAPGAGGAVH